MSRPYSPSKYPHNNHLPPQTLLKSQCPKNHLPNNQQPSNHIQQAKRPQISHHDPSFARSLFRPTYTCQPCAQPRLRAPSSRINDVCPENIACRLYNPSHFSRIMKRLLSKSPLCSYYPSWMSISRPNNLKSHSTNPCSLHHGPGFKSGFINIHHPV